MWRQTSASVILPHIASWQSLFEKMEAQGLVEIVQKPDKFYEVRGSEKLKRGYFKIKLLRCDL